MFQSVTLVHTPLVAKKVNNHVISNCIKNE